MKAEKNLESRVKFLENKVENLGVKKKSKMNEGKVVLTTIFIFEKVWKLIQYLFSEFNG